MSFASETKKELTTLEMKPCCNRAELAALIRMNGTLALSNKKVLLSIQTENVAIARRIYTLIKSMFDVNIDLLVRKKMRLKKNNVYIVKVTDQAQSILETLKISDGTFQFATNISTEIIQSKCCRRAYLRGAFLAGGSVNNPKTSAYHMEVYTLYREHAEAVARLMNDSFYLNARILERKKGYIVYLKEAERIGEFLNIIGAHSALLRYEDVRIVRDMRNSVNRLVNCETANLNKTIGAAVRQIENIKFIESHMGIENLPEKLREIARLRIEHQEVTLKELGEMISTGTISKSGINHRLRKIDEIAEKLRTEIV
ncbi:MAG: DNA-binding protein WhiA [Bacilli bacterium]